jgi:hypothetical protein
VNPQWVPLSQRSAVDYRRYMAPLAPVQHTRTGRRGHGPSGALAQGAEPITRPMADAVRPTGAPLGCTLGAPLRMRPSTLRNPYGHGRWCRG